MKIKFYKSLWGMTEGATLDEKFALIKQAGYDGVEWHPFEGEPSELRDLQAKHGLEFIAMINMLKLDDFPVQMDRAQEVGAVRVTAHTGRDKMSFDEGCRFFEGLLAMEKDYDIPVGHETHRHRLFYAPWVTARYLNEFPDLKVVLDLSHWCCVCESLLDDMPEWVDLAISRAVHVHTRVGHEHGPQVPDPAAPEFRAHLDKHTEWWDAVLRRRQESGAPDATFTQEFGPPNYMPILPYTGQPVANLWRVCLWMKEHLQARWGLR